MAKIHVMSGGMHNVYQVVVHIPVPAGNNLAGFPWTDCIKNSGHNKTTMEIGTGPGQITQAEADQIVAGTVIEGNFIWGDDPAWTNAQRQADLDLRATQLADELSQRLSLQLRYFGFTRT